MGYFIKRSPAASGMVSPVVNSIQTAGASAGPYSMTIDYSTYPGPSANNAGNILVFLGGIYQAPTSEYSISGTGLTFTTIPPDGVTITVVHHVYSTEVPAGSEF